MAYLHYLVASICIFVLCIERGSAISCFVCNSHNDTRCAYKENLPEELKQPCPRETPQNQPYVLCRKIKQVIDFEVNGLPPDTRIIRSCGWDNSNYANRCYQRSGFGGRQEVCACSDDFCNGASAPYVPVSLTLALLTLVKVLM